MSALTCTIARASQHACSTLGAALHGVTTQMTYFTICLFQLTTWLFHIPHGISVLLLFLYLTRLVSLVTYLFPLTLFKCWVLVVLASLKSHLSSFYLVPYPLFQNFSSFFSSLLHKSRTRKWWAAQHIHWGLVLIRYCTILDLVDSYLDFYSASSLSINITSPWSYW